MRTSWLFTIASFGFHGVFVLRLIDRSGGAAGQGKTSGVCVCDASPQEIKKTDRRRRYASCSLNMYRFLALLLMHLTLTPLCWAIWRQQLPFQLTPQSIPPTVVIVDQIDTQPPTADMQQQQQQHSFTLQSVYHHASSSGPIPGLFRRHSISKDTFSTQEASQQQQRYDLQSLSGTTYRPVSLGDVFSMYRHQRSWLHTSSPVHVEFKEDHDGLLPDTKHRPTILALAMMTNNAYSPADNSTEWYDLGTPWNVVCCCIH